MYSGLNETKGVSDIKYKQPHSRATVKVKPNGYGQDWIYTRSRTKDTKHRKRRRGNPKMSKRWDEINHADLCCSRIYSV